MIDVAQWWFGFEEDFTQIRVSLKEAQDRLRTVADYARVCGISNLVIDKSIQEGRDRAWFEYAMGETEEEEE